MRRGRLVVGLGIVAMLAGADVLTERVGAHAIVDAPNRHAAPPATTQPGEQRIVVGPPAATLSVMVAAPRLPPRATIFILHGIRDSKEHVRAWADHLNEAGYRTVLVDSRGHGRSTGDWLSYGVLESRDLSQLLDALHFDGPIGVMGVSYGGATAVEWAGSEPRVKAAVAVAAFASLRDIVPIYTPRMVPLLGWLIPRWVMQRTVDHAGRLGGFDPDAASPKKAAQACRTPILLVHGRNDTTVPYEQSEMIRDGARDHVTLAPLEAQDHDHIAGDPRLWPLVLDFFGRTFP
ncbi:MAG: acetoin dehydrogenase subunit dihydrolipoyllysine-residue acetyltransferase [Myxococcales bacterium]|nr:acetoin dehydrogenase subunit dihydrolipoyllysine-residue acetyltransferase [Myxococcales bacterium]